MVDAKRLQAPRTAQLAGRQVAFGLGLPFEGRGRGEGRLVFGGEDVDDEYGLVRRGSRSGNRLREHGGRGPLGPLELPEGDERLVARELRANALGRYDEALAGFHRNRPQVAREVISYIVELRQRLGRPLLVDCDDSHSSGGDGDPRRAVLDAGGDESGESDVVDVADPSPVLEDRRLGDPARDASGDVAPQVVDVPHERAVGVCRPQRGEGVDDHPRNLACQQHVGVRVGHYENRHLGDEPVARGDCVAGGRRSPADHVLSPDLRVV